MSAYSGGPIDVMPRDCLVHSYGFDPSHSQRDDEADVPHSVAPARTSTLFKMTEILLGCTLGAVVPVKPASSDALNQPLPCYTIHDRLVIKESPGKWHASDRGESSAEEYNNLLTIVPVTGQQELITGFMWTWILILPCHPVVLSTSVAKYDVSQIRVNWSVQYLYQ